MRTLLFAAVVLLSTLAPGAQRPQDYTQWRGLARDGSASAFMPPRTWPEQLKRRWRVPVGEYATPLILGDVVYVFTRVDGEVPFYSAASSPVGDSSIVIAHPGNYGPLTGGRFTAVRDIDPDVEAGELVLRQDSVGRLVAMHHRPPQASSARASFERARP